MNIRTVRNKIKSVVNVRKITKAMQLTSAIKMKKAQQLALEGKPYRENLEKIINKLVRGIEAGYSPLMQRTDSAPNKSLVIILSSNKGLCGAFNFNLFRYLGKQVDFDQNDFITIGRKGALFIGRMGGRIIADFSEGTPLIQVSAIFNNALDKFLNGTYKSVTLYYNKFINTLRFESMVTNLLPFVLEKKPDNEEPLKGEYTVEPSPALIIDRLLRSFIEEKVRGAIIESEAAEHSARMIAMKNATDNAEDIIYNLTLLRNRIRQERITMELLDMITAKESVES